LRKVEFTIRIRNRTLLIIGLVIVGSALAYAVSKYLGEPPVQHHVTTGKVGRNEDGTVWIAEYIGDWKALNYTLPYGAVYSRFIFDEFLFILAVPEHAQDFRLVRSTSEDSGYLVHIPEFDEDVPIDDMGDAYESHGQVTELNDVYYMLEIAIEDARVLSLVRDMEFSINGMSVHIVEDYGPMNSGFVFQVGDTHYLVVLHRYQRRVVYFDDILFDEW